MAIRVRNFGTGLAAMIIAAGAVLFAAGSVYAQQKSQSDISDALKGKNMPRSLTRSLNKGASAEERKFIEGLRTRSLKTRAITVEEREKIAEIAKTKPQIDLEINFEFNSAVIGPRAISAVEELGKALASAEFKGTVLFLNGHTDAKGSDEYNQVLSERRAEAVKVFLIEKFSLARSEEHTSEL